MSRLPVIPKRFFRLELRVADTIVGSFILVLSLLEIAFHSNVNGWQTLVVKNAIVLFAVFGALWGIQNISSNLLQSLSRILGYSMIISFIYREMGSIIHIFFPHWMDPNINSVELAFFGWYPTEWFQTIARPWLNELMMFAYVIYGLLIPMVAFFCYKMGKKESSRALSHTIDVDEHPLLCLLHLVSGCGSFACTSSGAQRADGWVSLHFTCRVDENEFPPSRAEHSQAHIVLFQRSCLQRYIGTIGKQV